MNLCYIHRPMASSVQPFVVLAGEGEHIRGPAGGPTTLKARAETTNGTFTALENIVHSAWMEVVRPPLAETDPL